MTAKIKCRFNCSSNLEQYHNLNHAQYQLKFIEQLFDANMINLLVSLLKQSNPNNVINDRIIFEHINNHSNKPYCDTHQIKLIVIPMYKSISGDRYELLFYFNYTFTDGYYDHNTIYNQKLILCLDTHSKEYNITARVKRFNDNITMNNIIRLLDQIYIANQDYNQLDDTNTAELKQWLNAIYLQFISSD